jgi:hypothetical protein
MWITTLGKDPPMLENTRDNLLETIAPGGPENIICPACGVPITLTNPGSFELNLTVNARKEFNEVIRGYGAFLARTEGELLSHNLPSLAQSAAVEYPYEKREGLRDRKVKDGIYDSANAKFIGDYWWRRFDHYEYDRLIHDELPTIADMDDAIRTARTKKDTERSSTETSARVGVSRVAAPSRGAAAPQSLIDAVVRVLLDGAEPYKLIGRVMSLTFDQPHVRRWLKSVTVSPPAASGNMASARPSVDKTRLNKILADQLVAPTYAGYLDRLETVSANEDLCKMLLSASNTSRRLSLIDKIGRLRLVLVLLLGHVTNKAPEIFPGLIGHKVPFVLPRRVVISPRFLPGLLEAVLISGHMSGFRLTKEYGQLLEDDEALSLGDVDPNNDESEAKAIRGLIERLGPDTHQILQFACQGPSGQLLDDKSTQNADPRGKESNESPVRQPFAPKDPDICGWFPKKERTHPIVFIGSPGTGKSTVMLSGLLQFYNNAQALGAVVGFQTDRDLKKYYNYVYEYWRGIMPTPTPAGSRNSIQIRIEDASRPTIGANFIFTDVAGEVTARSVREKARTPSS